MEVVYKAFDGKIFESEEKCFDYEAKKVVPAVKYYFENDFHVPSNQQEEHDFMENSEYILIPASEVEIFKLHMEKFGFSCPKTEGLWFWDGEECQWEKVEDMYQKFIAKIQEIDRIKKLAT